MAINPTALHGVDAALLDIEGTICPVTFVKDTLFPYALNALPAVLQTKWDDPEFTQYRDAFPPEARASPAAFEAHVKDLTQRDVKIAYLKALQGYLWKEGYQLRSYSTPLFEDVLPSLQRWHDKGIEISIYSSGSVYAQKLLFAHIRDLSSEDPKAITDKQDLIKGWFDTTNAGPKTEPESYAKIASELGKAPGKILFLSDNVKEVKAAVEAGVKAVIVDRPGNTEVLEGDARNYGMVSSLEALNLS